MVQAIHFPAPVASSLIWMLQERRVGQYFNWSTNAFEPYNVLNAVVGKYIRIVNQSDFLSHPDGICEDVLPISAGFLALCPVQCAVIAWDGTAATVDAMYYMADIDVKADGTESFPLDAVGPVTVAPTGLDGVLVGGDPLPVALDQARDAAIIASTACVVAPTGLDGVIVNGRPMPIAVASTEQDARLSQAAVSGASSGAGTGNETYKDRDGVNAFVATIDTNGNRTGVTYQ